MTRSAPPLRQQVLVVDDHQSFADLVEYALEQEERLEFVGYAFQMSRPADGHDGPAGADLTRRGLTSRELDVLRLLGHGLDSRTISRALAISLHTCRGHVKNVLAKLGAHSQLEAVVLATRAGLISVGD